MHKVPTPKVVSSRPTVFKLKKGLPGPVNNYAKIWEKQASDLRSIGSRLKDNLRGGRYWAYL